MLYNIDICIYLSSFNMEEYKKWDLNSIRIMTAV